MCDCRRKEKFWVVDSSQQPSRGTGLFIDDDYINVDGDDGGDDHDGDGDDDDGGGDDDYDDGDELAGYEENAAEWKEVKRRM